MSQVLSVNRLGVGAAAPDAGTTSRDTVRLKGQLVGKKRERVSEQAEVDVRKADDEDEEESRAGAIKKKAKLDPFAKPPKKKGGTTTLSAPVPPIPSTPKVTVLDKAASSNAESAKASSIEPEQPTQTFPQNNQEKKKWKSSVPSPSDNVADSGSDDDDAKVESALTLTARSNMEEKGKSFVLVFGKWLYSLLTVVQVKQSATT